MSMFGAEVIRTLQQGKPRIDLKIGGANVFIAEILPDAKVNPPPQTPYQGLDHFGLSVREIDAVVAELKAKRAIHDGDHHRPGVRIALLHGPEGAQSSCSSAAPTEEPFRRFCPRA